MTILAKLTKTMAFDNGAKDRRRIRKNPFWDKALNDISDEKLKQYLLERYVMAST